MATADPPISADFSHNASMEFDFPQFQAQSGVFAGAHSRYCSFEQYLVNFKLPGFHDIFGNLIPELLDRSKLLLLPEMLHKSDLDGLSIQIA